MDGLTSPSRKPKRSANTGNCVFVGATDKAVVVTDDKQEGDVAVRFTREQWNSYIASVKKGNGVTALSAQ